MNFACRALAFALMTAPLIGGQFAVAQQAKASEASAAEIAFWNSVKNSKNAEEIKAYLDVFPNGTFAPLARLRLKQFGPRDQAVEAAPKAGAVSLDEATVREAQERLYNLNYIITAINGKLTAETVEAVRALQKKLGEPVTGELTDTQIAKLRTMDPPKVWGAIAASGKALVDTVWSLPSRREAEGKALIACRARSTADCKVFAIADRQCAAAASWREAAGNGKTATRITISRQVGLGPAQISALAVCNKDPKSQGRCDVIAKVCADGSHSQSLAPAGKGT